jgi:hypothetical protein
MRLMFGLLLLASVAPAAAQEMQSSSPAARKQMQAYGACVADGSPDKSARTLSTDFRTPDYRAALLTLNRNNLDCSRLLPRRSRMRSSSLLFAGAMAERLMARDPAPLNVRLAKAAMLPAPPFRSPTDVIAMCVVRSAPDETARLFATEVASEAEAQAVKALDLAVKLCSRGRPALQINTEGLRAMLATAAFRNVHPVALAERD